MNLQKFSVIPENKWFHSSTVTYTCTKTVVTLCICRYVIRFSVYPALYATKSNKLFFITDHFSIHLKIQPVNTTPRSLSAFTSKKNVCPAACMHAWHTQCVGSFCLFIVHCVSVQYSELFVSFCQPCINQSSPDNVTLSNSSSICSPGSHPQSRIHNFIPGSKHTFSAFLFHHSLLAPTGNAVSDYTGLDLFCSTVFIFSYFSFFLFWVVRYAKLA